MIRWLKAASHKSTMWAAARFDVFPAWASIMSSNEKSLFSHSSGDDLYKGSISFHSWSVVANESFSGVSLIKKNIPTAGCTCLIAFQRKMSKKQPSNPWHIIVIVLRLLEESLDAGSKFSSQAWGVGVAWVLPDDEVWGFGGLWVLIGKEVWRLRRV